MKRFILIPVLVLLMLTFGCGKSDEKDEKDDAGEGSGRLEKMDRDLKTASVQLDKIGDDLARRIGAVEKKTDEIKKLLEKMTGRETTAGEGHATIREGSGDVTKELENLSDDIATIVESLESLTQEVASFRGEMSNVATASREVSERVERRRTWEEMGDGEKLAERLATLSTAYGEKLDETGRRDEFEAEIEALKSKASTQYTTEELAAKYIEDLTTQINETTEDRRRGWYERRLERLQNATGDDLTEMISNYRRFENMRELSGIIRKYDIPRELVQEQGLITFGGRGGRRGGGRRGGGRGGRTGGGGGGGGT